MPSPGKQRMSSFSEGKRFDRAVQQTERDMAGLRAKFGAETVRKHNPDARFDDFTKEPIAALIRTFTRRKK